jgi:hypothetical protein
MSFEYKIERITRSSTSVCKDDRQGGSQFTALLYPVEYAGHLQVTQAVADEAEYVSHLSSQTLQSAPVTTLIVGSQKFVPTLVLPH